MSRPIRRWLAAIPRRRLESAILDPALTLSQPTSGHGLQRIDAVAHAVETAVTKKRNPLSLVFSREAFRLTMRACPVSSNHRGIWKHAAGCSWVRLGATAIENSMLGAAHSAANPSRLGFGIPHGHAVGLMLPHVVRFNAHDPATAQRYAEIACAAHLANPSGNSEMASRASADHLHWLLHQTKMPLALRIVECRTRPPRSCCRSCNSMDRPIQSSPVNPSDFQQLFAAALSS